MKKMKYYLLLFLLIVAFVSNSIAQSVSLDEIITSDTVINLEAKFGGTCNCFKLNSEINFLSDSALVRVVIRDDHGLRHLVFESYPLISTSETVNFIDYANESMYLPENTRAIDLEVYTIDAECQINDIVFETRSEIADSVTIYQHRIDIERQKVAIMNQNLEERGLLWRARVTDLCLMKYEHKVTLWHNDMFNLQGYDYYAGGIFSDYSEFYNVGINGFTKSTTDTFPLVQTKSFDWRKAHGANNPASYYWDDDPDSHDIYGHVEQDGNMIWTVVGNVTEQGNGWMTKVKDQDRYDGDCAGGCFIFAPISAMEAAFKLYYNTQIDFDLSEQHLVECVHAYDNDADCYGGSGTNHNNVMETVNNGYMFIDEEYLPWLDSMSLSISFCKPALYADVKIHGAHMINIADDANSVKRALLQYGPITACPKPGHLCALVGFEYLEAGDSLNINDGYGVIVGEDTIPDFIKVPENHPFIGKTAWIFKENFGINRGENGYLIKLATSGDIITGGGFFAFDYPGYCDMIEPDWYDWDGDGYYFWGLGPKPAGCPGPDLEDCDDFDVQRIYYDENYFCTYDCDLIASMMSDEPIYINNDTTIYGDKLVKPIVVDNNSTLKLSGEFHCAENVYIQAEIGSTIDLDGATFMSICGTTWQGIRLISNLDPLLGETGRSMLISDYSEIQNAECAISGDVHSIIRADNTRFVDNLCDLKLQPRIYTNFYGEVTIGNNSEFNDCMFYTSHNWHNQSIEENIILKYVKNVNFNSCFFEDQGIVIDKFSMENRTAIKTYHSGFNATECTFTHNSYAAQIINSLYLPVNLENNTIINNYRGFYLLQTHGSIIIHNDLQFDDDLCRTSDANEIPYGIYLDNCHDYQLERNIIRYYDTESISDYICGIVINDNGGFQDKIYRNIIGKLSVGMEAIGVNRDIINYNDGLQISCNTLNSVYNDIFVTNNLNNPYPSEYPIGIAGNQGSLQYPAGNLFTGENNSGSGEDPNPHDDLKVIENYINVINDTKSFNYYYHDLSENTRVLPDSVIGLVTLVETNVIYDENSCPDYTDTESSETQTGIHALNSLVLDITNKENTLEYLIDGGNTDMTIAEIILASDYFAYETYLGLIAKSPYLSKKSLIEIAMKEDGLTVPMIRDILVKNPHAAKDPEIKTILKQRIDVLPDYMLEQIEQGLKLVSAKDYLEAQISVLETEFNRQSAVLLRKYIRDTEIYGESDFMQVLDLNPDFQSQLISSEYYALNRDFNTAKSIINTIVAKTEEQQAILTNMSNLYNVMIELELTNSDESEYKDLTGKDKILLEIAAGNGPAAAYAKGMLSWSGYMVYKEPVFLPSVDIYPGDRNLGIDKLKEASYFTVYPNPCKDHIYIDYNTESEENMIYMSIFNADGKMVDTRQLKYKQDIVIINTVDLQPGTYIIRLYSKSKSFGEQIVTKI